MGWRRLYPSGFFEPQLCLLMFPAYVHSASILVADVIASLKDSPSDLFTVIFKTFNAAMC